MSLTFNNKLTNDNIRSDTIEEETWMIEKDVIEQNEPIVLWKDFAEHCLHQGPSVILRSNFTRRQMTN